jgi:hypothetical protein
LIYFVDFQFIVWFYLAIYSIFLKNSLLIKSLRKLGVRERRRFLQLVASPYFNVNRQLEELLKAVYAQLEANELSREKLDQTLYPDSPYTYTRITNHLSDLKQLLEVFLVNEQLKQEPERFRLQLLTLAQDRNQEALFQQTNRQWERWEKDKAYFAETDFLYQHLIEEERYVAFTGQDLRKPDQSLERKMEAGERYYAASMLKSACQLLNRRNVLQDETEPPSLLAFREWWQGQFPRFENWLHLRLYHTVWQMLENPTEEKHYQNLRVLLEEHQNQIPTDERKPLYQYAQNYCIRMANQGQGQYLAELFQLYQAMIKQDLLYHQGHISSNDLKNIVVLGSRLKEFVWTEQFLERYSRDLLPEIRENATRYHRAYLHYAQGERREAMRLLSQVAFQDVYYFLESRSMLVRIYYELEEDDSLLAMLHAFENALRRNRLVSAYRRKGYQQFIRLLRKLCKLRGRWAMMSAAKKKAAMEDFDARLQAAQGMINRLWMEGQWEELRGERGL